MIQLLSRKKDLGNPMSMPWLPIERLGHGTRDLKSLPRLGFNPLAIDVAFLLKEGLVVKLLTMSPVSQWFMEKDRAVHSNLRYAVISHGV